MPCFRMIAFLPFILFLFISQIQSQDVKLYQTAQYTKDRLSQQPAPVWEPDYSTTDTILTLNPSIKKQKITGFGAAITYASAYVFSLMNSTNQANLLEAFFGVTGINFNLLRIAISSCDYGFYSYNYDEYDGDYDLKYMDINLTIDKEIIIPLIYRALDVAQKNSLELLFMASPWSPPAWMKIPHNNLGVGMNGSAYPLGLIQTPEISQTYANYIATWINSYQSIYNIPIWSITLQNEPQALQPFESCLFTANATRDFVRDYLGPILRKQWPTIKIFGWDHNKWDSEAPPTDLQPQTDQIMTNWVKTLYGDPVTASYVDGIAFHWYQIQQGQGFKFDVVNDSYYLSPPNKLLLATEATMGHNPLEQNWTNGEWIGIDLIGDLNNWANGWMYWNLLLNDTGGPNHVGATRSAPSIYIVGNGTLLLNPEYYYLGHSSKFVPPNSTVINTTLYDPFTNDPFTAMSAYAVIRPDNLRVIVVMNPTDNIRNFKILDNERKQALRATIPAHAIQTYIYGNNNDSEIDKVEERNWVTSIWNWIWSYL